MRTQALQLLRQGTVIPATPLALDKNYKFNEKRQRLLMQYYLHAGSGGIATAVHSTQFEIRKPEVALLKPVLEIVAEEIARYEEKTGRTVIRIAGVCGPEEQAVKEAELAKQLGYDAVLLSPGGLGSATEHELIERTRSVGAVLPVIAFYLQPAVGGRQFSYEYWQQICNVNSVVAVKAAPFNRYMTLDVVRAAATSARSSEISLYTGNDDNIIVDLLSTYKFTENGKNYEKSFVGGLLGHWSVWTHTVVALFEQMQQVKNGEISKKWARLANEVTDCNSAFFDTRHNFAGCIPGLHEVLRRQGLLEGTWCLNQHEVLSAGQMQEIDRVYNAYPHLHDDAFIARHLAEWKENVGL